MGHQHLHNPRHSAVKECRWLQAAGQPSCSQHAPVPCACWTVLITLACRQQASPAFFQELAAWDAAGAPRDPAVWQSVRGCLKLVTRAQLLEECPATGLGVLLHLLLAQVQMELCCMRCCRAVPCSPAWGCCCAWGCGCTCCWHTCTLDWACQFDMQQPACHRLLQVLLAQVSLLLRGTGSSSSRKGAFLLGCWRLPCQRPGEDPAPVLAGGGLPAGLGVADPHGVAAAQLEPIV